MSLVEDVAKEFMEENKELMTDLALQEEIEHLRAQLQTLTQDVSHWKHEAGRFKEALTLAYQDFKRVNNLAVDQAQNLAIAIEALEKIATDKWCMNTDMKSYDCSVADVANSALAKIRNLVVSDLDTTAEDEASNDYDQEHRS